MLAQAGALLQAGYPVTVIAGRGAGDSLPSGCKLILIPEIDSLHPLIQQQNTLLEKGILPDDFMAATGYLAEQLRPLLKTFDTLIIHNVLTKHFNLALTAALYYLIDEGSINHTIAWCHDFSWTSPSSHSKVFPRYPWDLLRTYHAAITYITVSERRKESLVELLGCRTDQVQAVYNGVDPQTLLGLSIEGMALIERLGLLESDLTLLMPVRVTQAKNIEYALHLTAALKERCRWPRLVLSGPPDPHEASSMAYFDSLLALRSRLGVDQEMRFVYESGPQVGQPYQIDETLVGELYRVSDVVFMPSHREGFGMPLLEAGLAGIPVVTTNIPAAAEIGGQDVMIFDSQAHPEALAEQIIQWIETNPLCRLRRKVRQRFTWRALFRRHLEQLLVHEEPGHAP